MASVMAIGILCDDTNLYNEALTYFKTGIGAGNIEQAVYYMNPGYLGQGQEEGRDQGHSGLDVSLLGVVCTMAYNQGDDLFAYQNNRVLSLCEYFAKYNLGNNVPYLPYKNCDATIQSNIGSSGYGDIRPCWDLIYNHYANLKGLAAPWSQQYAALVRPEGGGLYYGTTSGSFDQLGFTTLTCSLDPIVVGANPSGLTANLNGPQQVLLNWWGTANATNYLVKRATTSGGPYTTIATITTNLLTYTDSNVTNGVTYYYSISALTLLGESGNGNEAVVSVQPQLIAYYKFNESSGTSAADASGNGQTATLNGATWTGAGHSNNAVNLSGSSQYVTLPNGITTNLADFTIATWVYLNGSQGWARIFDFGVGGAGGSPGAPMRYMSLIPSVSMEFIVSLGTWGGNQYVTGSAPLPTGGWHHAAVTLAGTNCSVYVDGVLSGTGTITITPAQLGTTTQNCIGRSQFSSDPYLNGLVDDFRIYNGALSAAQIAALVAAYPVQPPAPTNVVATTISANEIDLTWSPANGATNYYVKRSLVNGGPYSAVSVPLTKTNFSDTGLTGGTTYYYVIAAANDGGTTNSAQVSATTLTAPPAPASLTATAGLVGTINLSWPASSGATSYSVKSANFSGGPYTDIATNVIVTGYTNTGLSIGVTYYYVVSASNANGQSTNSVQASATAPPLPSVPTGVAAIAGNASAQVSWSAASSATSYNVKRSTTSGSGYVTATNFTGTSVTDTNLNNGTTYYYVVSSVSAAGESANSSEVAVQPNAGVGTTLNWSGAVNGTWDITTANWLNGAASATFVNGNTAIFGSPAANTTINLAVSCSPSSTVVNNTGLNYTLGGSPIAGIGSLTKSGSGTLTLSGANTFSGGTTLNAGQITLGASATGAGNSVTGGPLGTGTVTLGGGKLLMNAKTLGNNLSAAVGTTTIIDNTGGDGYLDGNLSGGGTVTLQNSSGIGLSLKIAFNATVNWSGFTGTLNYYAVNSQVFNVFLPTSGNLSQATLNCGGGGTPPGNWSSLRTTGTTKVGALSGSTCYLDIFGTLEIGGANTNTAFSGAIIDTGVVTKVGTGTLTLTGANTYTGLTTVSNGTLIITTTSPTKGNYTVATGATLGVTNVSSGSAIISNLTVAAGSALEFQKVASTTTPLVTASNITVNGTCTGKITGASGLVAGNGYPLINYAGTFSGAFTNLQLQMPYGWRGTLAQVGKQILLTNVAVVSTTPPPLGFGTSNGLMQLNWPSDHTGWRLLMNTDLASPNWTDVSSNLVMMTNQVSLPVVVTNGSVFYRLVYP